MLDIARSQPVDFTEIYETEIYESAQLALRLKRRFLVEFGDL